MMRITGDKGWESAILNESGEMYRENVSKGFAVATGLYTRQKPCNLPYCNTDNDCDMTCWKLCWRNDGSSLKHVEPPDELLSQFVTLTDAKTPKKFATAVEKFARRWGCLDLCDHEAPASHNSDCEPSIPYRKVLFKMEGSTHLESQTTIHEEPLAAWWQFAIFARAILSISSNLREGALGEKEDWIVIHSIGHIGWSYADEPKPSRDHGFFVRSLAFERRLLSEMVNRWLGLGNVRPKLQWRANGTAIHYATGSSYGHLFTQLTIQLMFSIAKQDGLAICSACFCSYIPKRKTVSGRRRFCDNCVLLKKPQAMASADYRNRKNSATRLPS